MIEMTDASISFDSQLNMCEKRLCVYGDEWEPGEYVAKVLPGVGAEPLELTHERVIRCRECVHQDWGDDCDGDYDWCDEHNKKICLDGFCSWAEPKEES